MGKRFILFISLIFGYSALVEATHNRAGEITIRQTGDLTIEVTVTTYTKTSSTQADRDSVRVFWGDGSFEYVFRINGEGQSLGNDRKLNYYVATHTYPGRATYTISMMDPNRNGGILNVNPPNSEGVPFYIEATYTFLNPQFQGYNNTATLLQPPIDFACVGKKYIHNPGAFDVDGDSLAFEFIVPLQDSGLNVPNFIWPQQIEPGPDNSMTLDPVTGDLVWLTPQIAGEYNIAFLVKEYRSGVLISSFVRDMQILVLLCENNPPEISTLPEICLVAGEELKLPITISDPDVGQLVKTTASGGPFEIEGNMAILDDGPGGFQEQPFIATLLWTPQCEQIREQPYTVIIKATDNFFDTTGLVDLFAISIRVIGPAPENLEAKSTDQSIQLTWDLPYQCDDVANNYFRGFSIWKRSGSNQFVPDSCETGLDGRGYTKIASNYKTTVGGKYFYEDTDINGEDNYCYRILAEFALLTPSGQPYLRVESIPSEEVCLRARADRPLLTHVTVDQTGVTDGQMTIKWLKPDGTALDTTSVTGPYTYKLLRAEGIDGTTFLEVPGANFSSPTFHGLTDSMFVDQPLDTRTVGYSYKVDFYTGPSQVLYGSSQAGSSIFLTAAPSDEASLLSWSYSTPWDNFRFDVWRSVQGGTFEVIGTTTEDKFEDRNGIVNGVEYCYKIVGYGDYGLDMVPTPLINLSQETCVIPLDNVAPCSPNINVTNICDEASPEIPADAFSNYITWLLPCTIDDIAYYIIYYLEAGSADFIEIGRVDHPGNSFEHKPGEKIAGCYAVVAVDFTGNQSAASSSVCVENCPVYELPNAFTPNGDGQNDIFRPYLARFIESVDFKVFNRWGQIVYTTTDPNLNWSGTNNNGKEVSDGVYYYTCEAFENLGQTPIMLSGYIELIRG
jgi:gliding motility-associated-like protein